MVEIKSRKYEVGELEDIALLFTSAPSADESFAYVFHGGQSRLESLKSFLDEYSKEGELHTAYENGALLAASLWSPPYRRAPSPAYDFEYPEPCFKLCLIASREKGMGSALLRFALFRYEAVPLLALCPVQWQTDYFARFGFEPFKKTVFGTSC
jgi:hypothetical protein